jgi:HAD superfamily hydrolase (TIGR01509 family)
MIIHHSQVCGKFFKECGDYNAVMPAICKGILFDLDGTLADSMPVYSLSLAKLLWEKCQIKVTQSELRAVIAGRPTRETLRLFAPQRVDELAPVWVDYAASYRQEAKLFPGIQPALTYLSGKHIKLGVVTSVSRAELDRIRPWLKLDEWIQTWICLDDVVLPKPAPEAVLLGAARLGLTPGEVVMIGDAVNDLLAGQAAGVPAGAVMWGYGESGSLMACQPTYVFINPFELQQLAG